MINVNELLQSKKEITLNNKTASEQWHILLCFDDDYALPAGINIYSIIKNNADKALHFHLFMQNVSDANKCKVAELTSNLVSLTEYNINNKLQIHANNTKYFPVSACLRIIAPLIISKDINKLLYVDSDTLCLGSLEELFNTNLTDNVVAAVPDVKKTQEPQCKKFEIKYGNYFNSGVILYNIEKWNELDITDKALNLLNEGITYKFPDQDVLNLLLKDKIYYLPRKYNNITVLTVEGNEDMKLPDNTIFIHYVSGAKPWFRLYLTPIYQQYISGSPWKETTLLLANNKSPSTTRRYTKILLNEGKYFRAFLYYALYLKHKILKNNVAKYDNS
jgi:lipopolysaccharide biosynthesis glycosyltransferase